MFISQPLLMANPSFVFVNSALHTKKMYAFCNMAMKVKCLPNAGPAFKSGIKLRYSASSETARVSADSLTMLLQTVAVWDLIISGERPIMTADRFCMQAKVLLVFQFPSSLKRLLIYIIINSLKDDNLQHLMRSFTEHIILKLTGIKTLFQTI